MNPLTLILLLYLLSGGSDGNGNNGRGRPMSLSAPTIPQFDTFKMELLLDRMQQTVETFEKINKLRQMAVEPLSLPSMPLSPSLSSQSPGPGAEAGTSAAMPDIGQLMNTLGPVLSMLSAGNNRQ